MKVVILGGGFLGVSTAYFLAKYGVEVKVIEQESEEAMQCSFANGAQLSYSDSDPWASFGNILKGLKWIGKANAPLLLRPRLDFDMYIWICKFIMNAIPSAYEDNTRNLLKLGFYSRQVINNFLEDNKVKFDFSDSGILHIYKSRSELAKALKRFELNTKYSRDLEFKLMNRNEVVEFEPSSEHLMRYRTGAIFAPKDQIGDIKLFTKELVKICKKLGVKFMFSTSIESLEKKSDSITKVITNRGDITGDNFVVCTGAYSAKILSAIGIKIPIYPMKGYSITLKMKNAKNFPKTSLTDHQKKIVFTPIGDRLRVAGTAEFAGFDFSIPNSRVKPLHSAASKYFPRMCDYIKFDKWSCLRPQTPKSTGIISKTDIKNLFINSGHGSLGWTQGMGSAKAMADLVMKRKPEIDLAGFSIEAHKYY